MISSSTRSGSELATGELSCRDGAAIYKVTTAKLQMKLFFILHLLSIILG